MQTFEALKDAWANRKREVEARAKAMGGVGLFGGGGYGYGGAYGGQAQEITRLEQVSSYLFPEKHFRGPIRTSISAGFERTHVSCVAFGVGRAQIALAIPFCPSCEELLKRLSRPLPWTVRFLVALGTWV